MSQQHFWGAPRQTHAFSPISTALAHESSNTPSPSNSRPNQSPANSNFPSLPPASSRLVGSRKSSVASSASSPGQQLPASQLLSSRGVRTIAPHASSQLASSALGQGAGAQSSSGGGASKLVRASPSLSVSSTASNPSGASSQNLSRIVIAQIFLLLSQFGPLKDDKDRSKWDTQTEQISKVSHALRLRLLLITSY
jgi:CCR4-NOT transcription complex subunit 1